MTAHPARLRHMLPSRAAAKPILRAVVACLLLLGGCKHAASPSNEHPEGASSPAASSNSNENIDIFDPKLHPGATVVHTVDPHTLSESQVKFGVAPKRDPSVEYQPDIILMENGDKAIKSVASDGLTWTFDANAPQVSDFQEGKIVFATGRAVGRVLSLNRQGDSVKVILGPVQLTDVIRNGNFQMNEKIDLNNMISYVAPDYPQPPDPDQPKTSFNRQPSPDHMDERMVLSRVSRAGKWTPATMVRSFADGHRDSYYHIGSRWSSTRTHEQRTSSGGMRLHFGGARIVRASGHYLQMPGAAGVSGIQPLQIPLQPFDPPKLLGQLPLVSLAGGRAIPMAGSDGGVGVEYDYDKDGLKLRASGYMTLRNSGVSFFLHIKDGVQDCGIRLNGNVGIKLHLNASAAQDFKANFHKKLWLPIDLSIPLGGPAPLSLSFNSSLLIETAFSAKTSVLNAEGEYSFGAGMDAGYWAKKWRLTFNPNITTKTDIGNSVEGISVGINSVVMGFDVRTMVGIGAFGFNAGVYMAFRFSGTALKAPNIAFACRQGTIEIDLDTGVGYSIPKWVTDAINIFLSPFTSKKVDPSGTFMRGPTRQLWQHVTQIPEGCATPKGAG
ncbi:MAG TPA: hypothetical protein VHZ28_09455 [Terracidiphilus sp.]|jgi:hypothetical protein|nr:hypothetical protein [Terracidiphilus sp.]HEX4285310.1 hypothetical protein [Terracidiphilus sp.]